MQNAIKREIKRLSERAIARSRGIEATEKEYRHRFEKRTGVAAGIKIAQPTVYVDRHFDPLFCKRHANFLAKTLWHKITTETYEPKPALNFLIDKPAGGKRSLMAFSIPDAAIGNVLMRRLRERNIKKFSRHSFAYHPDKNIFDAILDLRSFIVSTEKIYSVQIDFKNYFDSIPSSYLKSLLDDRDLFSLTSAEKAAVRAILFHKYAQRNQYAVGNFQRRHRGTPQGSSISLILANLANHALDIRLEKLPGKFVRFADDVTALCVSYEDATRIENAFFDHCRATGIEINREKSPGIAVLSTHAAEIRTVPYIDYLGYRFTESGLTLSDKVIKRIKTKISKIISVYLLYYISRFGFNNYRVGRSPDYDWDMLGLISEIRKYLYGGLSEAELEAMLASGTKLRKVRGLMSFYALLENREPLAELDGWLANVVTRAIRKRDIILRAKYGFSGVTVTSKELILGEWMDKNVWRGDPKPEFRLPSFVRGWRAARKYYMTFGLKDVEPPKYGYTYGL